MIKKNTNDIIMEKLEELDGYQISAIKKALDELYKSQSDLEVNLGAEDLLSVEDACQLLGICPRTMQTYRKKQLLRFVKLNGRIFFLKIHLYEDLIAISDRSRTKP